MMLVPISTFHMEMKVCCTNHSLAFLIPVTAVALPWHQEKHTPSDLHGNGCRVMQSSSKLVIAKGLAQIIKNGLGWGWAFRSWAISCGHCVVFSRYPWSIQNDWCWYNCGPCDWLTILKAVEESLTVAYQGVKFTLLQHVCLFAGK